MNRRRVIAALPAIAIARRLLADSGAGASRLGLASFSSHQHWKAARAGNVAVKFTDARGFYDHARALGGDGVQASLRGRDAAFAEALRAHVEGTGGYFEGDVALPTDESGLVEFEREVRLTRLAGATVARTIFTASRRYEAFKTLAEFREFTRQASKRLEIAEPVARRNGLKLAVENHKDHTAPELAELMRRFASEWLGVTMDTGNNIALLEDPLATVEMLAPFALTVHLKDMAVQPCDEGFLLSEIPFGAGFLNLRGVIATLRRANPGIVFNVEMATRDPLLIPCRTDAYWATFGGRDDTVLAAALKRVADHPPKEPPPRVKEVATDAILAAEEFNNRRCLAARGILLSTRP